MARINGIRSYSIECTGDVCAGDEILFEETVWGGSHRRPVALGTRRIAAKVIKDSYGAAKQQHTFTLEVYGSDGYQPIERGKKIRRKGRNVYRNGCKRRPWDDEDKRREALDEKHRRGDRAREARVTRRAIEEEMRLSGMTWM